ncbi:MAG: zinc-binding dehydrogenase [Verrucomicrobia bacterium]|nr:zinc-binding dehydrogenase [Verrucomicrobiota bacterium]MBI3868300.1 zinc-binding dehydrogenase [Verrucomicrobiota bacterium]
MSASLQPAVVTYDAKPFSVELREIPIPTIGDDDVLLEVAAVGVCGSDLHMWTGDHGWKVNYPCVLGHEFAGFVRERGRNVGHFSVGDRVVSETAAVIDPNNPMSRRGLYNLDPTRLGYGAAVDGAMTRYVKVPQRILHRVPDALSFAKAALTEPCAVAYNATVVNAEISPGDRIVVLGPGPIGILCGAIARLRGADVAVVGLERDAPRLAVAQRYGCAALIADATEWARESDGLGADGVIDATGASASLQAALQLVRPAGWISKVGWGPQPVGFSLDPLVQKNIRLQGSFSHNWPIWERILRLTATGRLDLDPIIGGQWKLEQWREAFETMHSGKIVKAVLAG